MTGRRSSDYVIAQPRLSCRDRTLFVMILCCPSYNITIEVNIIRMSIRRSRLLYLWRRFFGHPLKIIMA